MHIVLCTDGIFPHAVGGMQRHSRLLAEHLARNGKVTLTVIHPHKEQVFDATLGITEVRVQDINRDKFYLRELWRYSDRVGKELEQLEPDVVLSQGFCVWKGIGRFSDRLIVHPHGLEMFQMLTRKERMMGWPFRRSLRYILRHSKVCISLGGKLTGILQQQVEGSPCEVMVIPNAVEVPPALAAEQRATNSHQPTLLFVGRFAFNKGLDVLMALAQRLVAEGKQDLVRFQLAGDGPLLAHYQQVGLPANVELLGRVDDAQLQKLYSACSAFVLPTRFEGMPTVVLEAMVHAKPIIVSDVGATAELVTPHNGYLLPPGDESALYDAVVAFAERRTDIHAQMGQYSRQRVEERFSWPTVTKQFEGLFAQVGAKA
ncbi:MAG: glycosyltransferase family 4 protein [Flavobacteriales bacterium]|nr:MAG: glycosyltransferase family 4 protein [Flavobacteriales bacterium]